MCSELFTRGLSAIALIAVVGFNLRSVILGVPPVLPAVRDDLHLTFTAAGALTALPVLCLGAASIPGAVFVNRFGPSVIVGAGTIGLGLAALLRLAPPIPAALYAFSGLMALCAAIAQPAMVSAIRAWFPRTIQQASTVFALALGLGGLGGSALSVHLQVLGGWRGTFAFWGALALAAGLLWLAIAPKETARQPQPGDEGLLQLVRRPAVWHVAAIFGIQSLVYYGSSSWIPFELRPYGPGYLSAVLLLFNLVGIPLAMVLVALPWPWATARPYYALAGVLMTVGTAAFALGLGGAWFWVMLLGAGTGMTFTGATALPALLAASRSQVAGYAAVVLTLGYAIAFMGPLMGGVLLDQTHRTTSPFWPMVAASICLVVLGLRLPRRPEVAAPPLAGKVGG
jgi:MFS transporter, CP family, cyanate transporter